VNAISHVILDQPLRCFNQMMTGYMLAEEHGATLHLTAGCIGEPTGKRPGMGSSCMPDGRCRHDLGELRREGAIDITDDAPCWTPAGTSCECCAVACTADMAVPAEHPGHVITAPHAPVWVSLTPEVQGVLW
jgi:hypothetical protein